MELVNIKNLSKSYGDKTILNNINLTITNGKIVGLLGKNGAGKSSLLKMLVGEHIEHSGTVSIESGLVVSYVQQDTSDLECSLSKFAETNNIEESLEKLKIRKTMIDKYYCNKYKYYCSLMLQFKVLMLQRFKAYKYNNTII